MKSQLPMRKYFSLDHSSERGFFGSRREGGISNIPILDLKRYISYIAGAIERKKDKEWLKSVEEFADLIQSDPILRMNWEYGIYQCKETLGGKTGEDVLEMIDTVCKKSPSFSHSALVGFPINALFVEFMQNENGRTFFSHQRVNKAIKNILNEYGQMLQSPQSVKYLTDENDEHGWFGKEANEVIHNQWYKCDPTLPNYGYKSWNQWFLREFKPGMRPIGFGTPIGVNDEDVIVNSCQSAPLEKPQQPQYDCLATDQFWLKDDHYSLSDMFGGKKYKKDHLAKHFHGGTVYQAFLSALYYHRWHAPIDGEIEDVYEIDGTYYLDQSQFIPYDQGSPNNSQSFLTAVAARKVILIKADNPKIGKVAIIYVGMAEVSSCINTVKIGDKVKKGDQLGYFMFGGSSHAIIFEKKAKIVFKANDGLYSYSEDKKSFETVKQNLHSYLAHVE